MTRSQWKPNQVYLALGVVLVLNVSGSVFQAPSVPSIIFATHHRQQVLLSTDSSSTEFLPGFDFEMVCRSTFLLTSLFTTRQSDEAVYPPKLYACLPVPAERVGVSFASLFYSLGAEA